LVTRDTIHGAPPARSPPDPPPMSTSPRQVFLTGGTGYLGRRLIPLLAGRGHAVRALVRASSRARLPASCDPVIGDALDGATFVGGLRAGDTVVQLVGTARPSPAKAAEFQRVDLVSVRESVRAAAAARVAHFVYVSVAHPAPVMQAYIDVRARGEAMIREAGLRATILRPWYVLGPGHRWPVVLSPMYWLLERLPSTRASAVRLGLVRLGQMLAALVWAVEHPADGITVLGVPEIRALGPAA
jgi:uncharacterized protein YbjT (DUF2867 family)